MLSFEEDAFFKDFKDAVKAKFEKGRIEHNQPWDAEHVDPIHEIQQELCDIYNYSGLIEDVDIMAKFQRISEKLWNVLEKMKHVEKP